MEEHPRKQHEQLPPALNNILLKMVASMAICNALRKAPVKMFNTWSSFQCVRQINAIQRHESPSRNHTWISAFQFCVWLAAHLGNKSSQHGVCQRRRHRRTHVPHASAHQTQHQTHSICLVSSIRQPTIALPQYSHGESMRLIPRNKVGQARERVSLLRLPREAWSDQERWLREKDTVTLSRGEQKAPSVSWLRSLACGASLPQRRCQPL